MRSTDTFDRVELWTRKTSLVLFWTMAALFCVSYLLQDPMGKFSKLGFTVNLGGSLLAAIGIWEPPAPGQDKIWMQPYYFFAITMACFGLTRYLTSNSWFNLTGHMKGPEKNCMWVPIGLMSVVMLTMTFLCMATRYHAWANMFGA